MYYTWCFACPSVCVCVYTRIYVCVFTLCSAELHEETGSMLELTRPVGSTSSQINCSWDQPLLRLCQIRALRQHTHTQPDTQTATHTRTHGHARKQLSGTHSWLPTAPETSEHISALRWELPFGFVCACVVYVFVCVWAVTGSMCWILEPSGQAVRDLCWLVCESEAIFFWKWFV